MATGPDGVDGRAGQGVVGREEPAKRLDVVVNRVSQHGECAGQTLHHVLSVKEHRGHLWPTTTPAHTEQFPILEELLGPPYREVEARGHLGESEPLGDELVGLPVDLRNRKRHETTT